MGFSNFDFKSMVYNEKRYSIKNEGEDGLIIKDKKKNYIYEIDDEVEWLLQVGEHEFLITTKAYSNEHIFERVKLKNKKISKLYTNIYSGQSAMLTDDAILLENNVYSISKNTTPESFKWLLHYKIEVLEKNNNKYLCASYIIESRIVGDNIVCTLVDVNTFKPIGDTYSSMRNKYIPVKLPQDVESIVLKDYNMIVSREVEARKEKLELIKRAQLELLKKV